MDRGLRPARSARGGSENKRGLAGLQNLTSDGIREEKAGYNVVRFIGLLALARNRFGPQAQRIQSLSC